MASGRGSGDRNRPSSTQYDNHDYDSDHNDSSDPSEENKQTRILVKKFKDTLRARVKESKTITEEDVEIATFAARYELMSDEYDIEKWKEDSSIDINKVSHALFQKSMAYAKTPKQVRPIYQAKQEQPERKPTKTSLESIIEPLKQLNEELKCNTPPNLFAAILKLDQDQISYADRMFYAEGCRLIGGSKTYTLDIAHDQVQAIRLMHYESEDRESLIRFIKECPTFETAHSYLRRLAKDRAEERSKDTSTRTSANARVEKSIILKDTQTKGNSYSPSSRTNSNLVNTAVTARASGRGVSRDDGTDDNDGNKTSLPRHKK